MSPQISVSTNYTAHTIAMARLHSNFTFSILVQSFSESPFGPQVPADQRSHSMPYAVCPVALGMRLEAASHLKNANSEKFKEGQRGPIGLGPIARTWFIRTVGFKSQRPVVFSSLRKCWNGSNMFKTFQNISKQPEVTVDSRCSGHSCQLRSERWPRTLLVGVAKTCNLNSQAQGKLDAEAQAKDKFSTVQCSSKKSRLETCGLKSNLHISAYYCCKWQDARVISRHLRQFGVRGGGTNGRSSSSTYPQSW